MKKSEKDALITEYINEYARVHNRFPKSVVTENRRIVIYGDGISTGTRLTLEEFKGCIARMKSRPTFNPNPPVSNSKFTVILEMPIEGAKKIQDNPEAFAQWMRENGYPDFKASDVKVEIP
jgi:hypothetical protein